MKFVGLAICPRSYGRDDQFVTFLATVTCDEFKENETEYDEKIFPYLSLKDFTEKKIKLNQISYPV